VKANLARNYPYENLTAHALGYVGRINEKELKNLDPDNYGATNYIGKLGIEKSYEDVLHGVVGYEYVETNARGETLRTLDRTAPVSGEDITLHLDLDLQETAKKALQGKRGAVVAMNTHNGGVLVAASSPSYNPNLFARGISHKDYNALREDIDLPLYNRFLQAQYPPGSTIKPVVSLAGLSEKTITKRSIVKDPGWYQLPNDKRLYRDWKREGHGDFVGFTAAIEESCDIYYYDLAYKLGVDNLHKYYGFFGLGERTGIDLPGERKGLNPSIAWKKADGRGSWFPGDTLNIGIGQGFLLSTPLQLANMTTILANKGERIVPQMVARVGEQVLDPILLPKLELNDEQNWQAIHEAMVAVIHGKKGTARGISRRLNYTIAGKTGTAQVVGIAQGEKYDAESLAERKHDHALFVGYAPADAPEVAIAVIVENGGSGSSVAAPIARAVLDVWMQKVEKQKAKNNSEVASRVE
jgi:penicillin-binding protein 2